MGALEMETMFFRNGKMTLLLSCFSYSNIHFQSSATQEAPNSRNEQQYVLSCRLFKGTDRKVENLSQITLNQTGKASFRSGPLSAQRPE